MNFQDDISQKDYDELEAAALESYAKRNVIHFYRDKLEAIHGLLSVEQMGQLFSGIIEYVLFGSLPEYEDKLVQYAFRSFQAGFDYDREAFVKKSISGRCGGAPKGSRNRCKNKAELSELKQNEAELSGLKQNKATDTDTVTETDTDTETVKEKDSPAARPPRSRFVPPSVEEVSQYAAEKHLVMDAERFCDFYGSNGWKVGRNPMKDWRSAARGWAARERESNTEQAGCTGRASRREQNGRYVPWADSAASGNSAGFG